MKKYLLDYTLKVRLPITIFVILCSFALTYYIARPERDGIGYAPEQPIKYSHQLHAGKMSIDCQYCHTGVDQSRHAMVPPTSTCVNCHMYAKRDQPEIIKLFQYYDEDKPIQWNRIHKVPDYAFFNHSVHVNKGIECQDCHGLIENMEVVKQVDSWTMGSCLNCHRQAHDRFPKLKEQINKGPENCNTCHR